MTTLRIRPIILPVRQDEIRRRKRMKTESENIKSENIKPDSTGPESAKPGNAGSSQNKILTIPNLLSLFRLCLIPVFMWLYCVEKNYLWTGIILIISGLTDTVDGFVARHFNMISDLGKILDPVADKLTQAAMLFCLLTRFPLMIVRS